MKKIIYLFLSVGFISASCSARQYAQHRQSSGTKYKGKNPQASHEAKYKRKKGKASKLVLLPSKDF